MFQVRNLEADADCDPQMVELLVKAATHGMSKAVVPDITTQSELLSAVFTLLDRTLRSIRKLQSPDERFMRAEQIRNALDGIMTDHGHVPN